MTAVYNVTDMRMLLNQAILTGDKTAERAAVDALAHEYEEIIQAQELMEKPDGSSDT